MRIPKQRKSKGKRWPKGQSSNSNPETKKFREAARSRFFRHESKNSTLTVDALKALDAFNTRNFKQINKSNNQIIDDATTFDSWGSAKTFKTFASDWSECSNMSFNRLLKKFEPSSALHKEMLAVLGAVTEVIKGNDGKETSTEYFGALMTALTVTESEESVSAILSLLTMCIKSVPHEVLRLKFSESSKILLDLLAKYCETENAVAVRSVIGCLSVLLRAQDPGVWSNSSTLDIFHSILVFATHSKPKIRKAAQHAVCSILKTSSMFNKEETHPAAVNAAKFCIQQIEKGESLNGHTTVLHILTLLKDIIGTFPKNYIKTTCETVLKLMTLGTPITISCSLEVLYGLFVSKPPVNHLTASLNAQILNALYDYQPSNNDGQAILAWLTVMQEALKALIRSNKQLCLENLTKFFFTASHLWLNDKTEVVKESVLVLCAVAMDCLPACRECHNYEKICKNIFTVVENGLKYQYHNAWIYIFNLLRIMFEVIGREGEIYMIHCLKSLANLRDSHNFSNVSALDLTIGKAIRCLGPEIVLKAIPFAITGNENNYEFKTSWMLPLLKENVQASSLKFFIDYFLPMTTICERKWRNLTSKNDKIGEHLYKLLELQIWSIFPSFCNNVEDIGENFKLIAKTLGSIISDREKLRTPVMTALRKLITRTEEKNIEVDKKELSRFAKNYLSILFTLYTTKQQDGINDGERMAAFDTIKVFLMIASEEVCTELFDRALSRIDNVENDAFMKESIMDLLKLLLPYQEESRLSLIIDKSLTTLKHNEGKKEGKKTYRLLETLFSSDSSKCKEIMSKRSGELLDFLLKSMKMKNIKYRGARLRCLLYLLKYVPYKQFNVLREIIPEAVISCKDINKRTRTFAFKLVEEVLNLYKEWSDEEEEEKIRDFIKMILVGFDGNPTEVSATVLALAKLMSSSKSQLPADTSELLLHKVCGLSASSMRGIVGSGLTYLKIFIIVTPKHQLFSYVPKIMEAMLSMTHDCKNHFRLKTRGILERLIRKFGYDSIKPLVPEDDVIMHKRLKNLKRIHLKKQIPKSSKIGKDSEDEFILKTKAKSFDEILASSEDESDDKNDKNKHHKNEVGTYIVEDADDIVDFLNPSASSKLTATKPDTKENKKKKYRDAKLSSDGRLIIVDDNQKIKSECDSDMEDIESMMSEITIARKRKLSASSDTDHKYQGGGTGIHRPIKHARLDNEKKEKRVKTKSKGQKKELQLLKTGKEYRAKKARGDVKRKGKPDPYAYIPFSRKLLNRRNRQKGSQYYNAIKSSLMNAKSGKKAKLKLRNQK